MSDIRNSILIAAAICISLFTTNMFLSSIKSDLNRIAESLEKQTYLMQHDKCGVA